MSIHARRASAEMLPSGIVPGGVYQLLSNRYAFSAIARLSSVGSGLSSFFASESDRKIMRINSQKDSGLSARDALSVLAVVICESVNQDKYAHSTAISLLFSVDGSS